VTERPSRFGATTLARLRPARTQGHRHLLTGSAVLVVGAAIQALSGAVFWLIAARLDPEQTVGAGGKLFTSVLFVTYLAGLGLPVALARYAADRDAESDTTFTWAAIATTITSLVLGTTYVALLHGSATGLLTDVDPVLGPLFFGVMVIGAALSLIVDVRCMTARRWNLVLVRITVVGLARFPLLLLFQDVSPDHRSFWLFAAATGPVALSGLIGAWFVPKVADGRHRLGPKPARTRAAVRYAAVNYVSTLAYQAPYFLLPVIVLANVSDDTYASFNVAWGIVAVAFYVPTAIGQALLAEGGRDGAHVHHQLRLAMWLALGLMIAGAVATFLGSDVITSVYGEGYAAASRILPAMVAAGMPWAITSLYLSEVRILHRHIATVAITVALTVGIVAPALVWVPDDGVDGASRAWLLGNLAAAVVAIIAVQVARARGAADPSLAEPETAVDAAEAGIQLADHTT
jgi:O-antigen/teichoic acid export membrane protein